MLADRFASVQSTFLPGLAQRATLFANHVISSEPAALLRLVAHAGKCVALQLRGTPAWWPAPVLLFEVTRAGLLELDERSRSAAPDLAITLDLSRPFDTASGWLGGERRSLSIRGDAGFAADASWLIDNLRWDVEDDLERIVGPVAAHGLARAGSGLASVAREALAGLAALRRRGDPAAR